MLKTKIRFWINSILNSYAQIFFSLNNVLAIIILLVTFIDPFLGACGLISIFITNILAYILGLSKDAIRDGVYGFNALLLGLALGFEYQFGFAFCIVFLTAIIILLFTTVWLSTILGKQRLPFLGLPFLVTYWLVYLAVGSFSFINLQEQYIYTENYLANASQSPIYIFAHSLDNIEIPYLLKGYLKTLSATFFQNSILAGIILAGGLLYFSRIAFTLSLIGFYTAYFFFQLVGLSPILLTEYLVGSNFIFLAIAIGGFYLVPSKWSYLSVLILIPVLSIFLISISKILIVFQLKTFTLSFSLVTILYLFFINNRWWQKFAQLVNIQYYSAEKTIYKHLSTSKRFANAHLAKLTLPFWGEWKVSQGYASTITHLGNWGNALDFTITDDENKTYRNPGSDCKDYYCYEKPVTAPYDGFIYNIINNIDDNQINNVDTINNWGNTIILNHQNGLFSQISHLKKDSFKVNIGEFVTRGTPLASCGNSGRSPEPHVHFQLQLSPMLGEITHPYPIAYFLEKNKNKQELKTFEIPKEGNIISNIETNKLLLESYNFQPGRTLRLRNEKNEKDVLEWKIFTDAWNRTYLYCSKSKSTLWFVNDGISFYCYDFEGDRKSLLFNFYLANYKILLACYKNLEINDSFPIIHYSNKLLLIIQDFIAPFYAFLNANFQSKCTELDNEISPKEIKISSKASSHLFHQKVSEKQFELTFKDVGMKLFTIKYNNKTTTYLCELY